MKSRLFRSFFLGGFDSCTQRSISGERLDMLATTQHDTFAKQDYAQLIALGIYGVRDGVRWHLIESTPGCYDLSTVLPLVRAARETGTQVIYDLFHYGWPDDLDIYRPAFVKRYAAFVRAIMTCLKNESDDVPMIVPVNEISFLSWGAGDNACLYPFHRGRAMELKAQLVRAAIEGIEAAWSVNPKTRIVHVDPAIHIVADERRREDTAAAEIRRVSMFQAWDMLCGREWPQLGGDVKYLDIIGVNYYPHNQWTFADNITLPRHHPRYRSLQDILTEVYCRYGRPMLISETGAIGDARPEWLAYVGDQVRAARRNQIPVEGVCLYPLINYPGWDNGKWYEHGLWGYADAAGARSAYEPLVQELRRQISLMNQDLGTIPIESPRREIQHIQ